MRDELKEIFIRGCNEKIEKKGEVVPLVWTTKSVFISDIPL